MAEVGKRSFNAQKMLADMKEQDKKYQKNLLENRKRKIDEGGKNFFTEEEQAMYDKYFLGIDTDDEKSVKIDDASSSIEPEAVDQEVDEVKLQKEVKEQKKKTSTKSVKVKTKNKGSSVTVRDNTDGTIYVRLSKKTYSKLIFIQKYLYPLLTMPDFLDEFLDEFLNNVRKEILLKELKEIENE